MQDRDPTVSKTGTAGWARPLLIVVGAVFTLLPVAISAFYVADETYGQWVTGYGWTNGTFSVHGGGPGGIPAVLVTFSILALLGVLSLCATARVAWLLWQRRRPGWLLLAWLFVLALCGASFLPSDSQYAAVTVAIKGPGKYWKYLEESAAIKDSPLLLDTLLRQGAPLEPSLIMVAAREGSNHVIKRLLDMGLAINEPHFNERYTPLHMAVLRRHHATAELLVRAGARSDIRDQRNRTPLDLALAQGDEKMTAILRAAPGKQ